jgi:hypothetical protein
MTPEVSTSPVVPDAPDAPDATVTPDRSFLDRLKWFFSFENRFLAPMLITLILLAGQISFGFLES